MVIYKITNLVNGKVYIGKTINKPRNRFLAHLKEARNGSQYYLHRAIRKYGKDNFKFEVIDDSAKTIEELDKLEFIIYSYIDRLKVNTVTICI